MVVLGLIAFDYSATLIHTFPELSPHARYLSPVTAIQVLLFDTSLQNGRSAYHVDRISGLGQAIDRLERKSRSFYLASSTFEGPLRIDLILL